MILATNDGGKEWSEQDSDTSDDLHAIHFSDDKETGWAIGEDGVILTTNDAGKKWSEQDSDTSNDLHAIHFSDDKETGWAVGEDGMILTTNDGGKEWSGQNSGTSESLYTVHFLNDMKGWVAGSGRAILHSDNGGATWSKRDGGTSKDLLAVQFAEHAMTGWAVGQDGTILKTTNGGSTWREALTKTKTSLLALHFSDDYKTGWAVGRNGMILTTTDAGEEWSQQQSGTTENLSAVHFVDKATGWAVGADGVIVKTTNGGKDWQEVTSGTEESLWAVDFTGNSGIGWAVGDNGTILKTTNGGNKWSLQSSRITQTLRAVYFSDNDKGWVAGDGGVIIATTNGGRDWIEQSSGTERDLKAILFKEDTKTGWIVGGGPSAKFFFFNVRVTGSGGVMLTTVNSGDTWHKHLGASSEDFQSLDFSESTRTGWIVGSGGTVLNFKVPDIHRVEMAGWSTYLQELKDLPKVSEFNPSLIISRAERLKSELDRTVKEIEESQDEVNLMRSPNIFGATGEPTQNDGGRRDASDGSVPASGISPEVSVQLVKSRDAAETRKLLTTNLTRVGVIGFFVYLISLLGNLYRYTMRLAAFCDGRADTLSIGRPETTEFAVLIDKFSPEFVEFSRRAAWPMERFAALAERVARVFRK